MAKAKEQLGKPNRPTFNHLSPHAMSGNGADNRAAVVQGIAKDPHLQLPQGEDSSTASEEDADRSTFASILHRNNPSVTTTAATDTSTSPPPPKSASIPPPPAIPRVPKSDTIASAPLRDTKRTDTTRVKPQTTADTTVTTVTTVTAVTTREAEVDLEDTNSGTDCGEIVEENSSSTDTGVASNFPAEASKIRVTKKQQIAKSGNSGNSGAAKDPKKSQMPPKPTASSMRIQQSSSQGLLAVNGDVKVNVIVREERGSSEHLKDDVRNIDIGKEQVVKFGGGVVGQSEKEEEERRAKRIRQEYSEMELQIMQR